jgi:quinolinate synthase
MKHELPEITMEDNLRLAAKKPLDRMLELSVGIK